MIPWDFGIINAFKNKLSCPIYPSEPEEKTPPYIVLRFDKYHDQNIFAINADFSIQIVDIDRWNNDRFKIAKEIVKIIFNRLELYQDDTYIGYAQTKVNKLENNDHDIILRLTATIYLSTMYRDGEVDDE